MASKKKKAAKAEKAQASTQDKAKALAPAPAKAPVTSKPPSKGAGKGLTKAQFIRDQGEIPAAEVVARGAKAGIKLSIAQVYVTRSHDKKRAAKGAPAAKPAAKAAKVAASSASSSGGARRGRKPGPRSALVGHAGHSAASHVQELRRIIVHVGLDNVHALIERVSREFTG